MHEAGHVMVARVLGCQIISCEINVAGDKTAGRTSFGAPETLLPIEKIAIAAAGMMAQNIAGLCDHIHDHAWISDVVEISELVEMYGDEQLKDAGEKHAQNILINHWDKVRYLAGELVKRSILTGEEIQRMLA
jgi:hypothetical protein